jgi:predicted DNA-binding transcriptional regulator YafY
MQLKNLLITLSLLARSQGVTKKELAEKLGVTERQVHRNMNEIEEMGFPTYVEESQFGRSHTWRLVGDYAKKYRDIKIPDTNLALSELVALYLLRGQEKLYRGTELESTIKSAFAKIEMLLPQEAVKKLQNIKTLFVPVVKFPKNYSGKEECIEKLTDAMLDRKTCWIKYHSFNDDRVKEFYIDPLHFFDREGGLYIFANTKKFNDVIILAVERIDDLIVSKDTYTYPEDFDPQALFESAFDLVADEPMDFKIWFSADQARYIKQRTWSKTQTIDDQPDGSIILSMTTSGMWDVKRWVLGYGAEAKVLAPPELVKEIKAELNAARKVYDKSK